MAIIPSSRLWHSEQRRFLIWRGVKPSAPPGVLWEAAPARERHVTARPQSRGWESDRRRAPGVSLRGRHRMLLRALRMPAVAGDFHGSAGVVAIVAAVLVTLLDRAIAGRMSAFLRLGHRSPLSGPCGSRTFRTPSAVTCLDATPERAGSQLRRPDDRPQALRKHQAARMCHGDIEFSKR